MSEKIQIQIYLKSPLRPLPLGLRSNNLLAYIIAIPTTADIFEL